MKINSILYLGIIFISQFLLGGCKKEFGIIPKAIFKTDTLQHPIINSLVRYRDSLYPYNSSIPNIPFGVNTTQQGRTDSLLLDFYEPMLDSAKKRTLVILAFGGAFEIGDKTNLTAMAKRFTRYGFTTASINYRLFDGHNPISNFDLKKQILFGIQDVKAAIRFFKKDAATHNIFRIDTNKIFLLGYSSGSMNVLHSAYMNSLEKIKSVDPGFLSVVEANGGLEGHSGNPGYSTAFKGVINLSGVLLNKNYIGQNDIPGLHIYGTSDNIIPIGDGLLSLPTLSSIPASGPTSLSAQSIRVGVSSSLYSITGGDHESPLTDNIAFSKMVHFLYLNL